MNILITGASGFIGSQLCQELESCPNYHLTKLSRFPNVDKGFVQSPDLAPESNWMDLLQGIDTVIHLAGRAHILKDSSKSPSEVFDRINYHGTVRLAKQAISSGVKRFIFFSSIGVLGELTGKEVLNENLPLCPKADYAVSKSKAEEELNRIFINSQSQLIIVRPTLVYSGSAPGNFRLLLNAVFKSIPMPIKSVKNKRMLVSLYNLTDFTKACIAYKGVLNETFIISDKEAISTVDIFKYLSQGMNKSDKTFTFPFKILKTLFFLIGKKEQFDKIFGDVLVNNSKAYEVLGWKPILKTDEALIMAGREYLEIKNKEKK